MAAGIHQQINAGGERNLKIYNPLDYLILTIQLNILYNAVNGYLDALRGWIILDHVRQSISEEENAL